MTGHDTLDRDLADWFEADAASPAPDGTLDRIVNATSLRRPRPPALAGLGSQWIGDGPRATARVGVRWSTAVLLLLVTAALVGGGLAIGARLLDDLTLPTDRLGHLAYGLDGDIFVADWDGSNPVKIASGAPDDVCPSYVGDGSMWSPDGRYLAYRRLSSCEGAVFISDPAGNVVASFPADGWNVAWAPDSSRIATWDAFPETVGVYGVDGRRQALLTVPDQVVIRVDYDPAWSSDGASLLFGREQEWAVPVDGSPARILSSTDPDADRFYVPQARNSGLRAYMNGPRLMITAASGSDDRVLATLDGVSYDGPIWSPSGERILVELDTSSRTELVVVDVASGSVTSVATTTGDGRQHAITWSPEGDRILYWAQDAAGVDALWSVRPDGSEQRELAMGSNWGAWQTVPSGQ